VWSDDKEAWYFVRDGDDDAPARTSWLPPKVLRGNGMDLCTPRSFARRKVLLLQYDVFLFVSSGLNVRDRFSTVQ
jgi:hypothetical protein